MRGRVTAVLLSLLFFTTALFPQCDYHLEYSAQYRASMFGVAVDGNDLWAATGHGVALFDRSVDPPRLVAALPLAGVTRIVRAASGAAYVAGSSGITVVRRSGRSLQAVQSAAIGPVNDLAVTPTAVFAATPAGIVHFDLPALAQSPAVFPTSAPNVRSLAISGSTLYAADGDSTLEAFSIIVPGSPQKVGNVATLPAAIAVTATPARIYVSDGQNTDVLTGSGASLTRLATLPYGAVTLADTSVNVVFAAGTDRTLRALDVGVPATAVTLFATDLVPNGGSVNRIGAIATAAGRVYVAAGDMGLITYDTSRFSGPYPLLGYPTGAPTSVAVASTAVYAGDAGGGIQEYQRTSSGTLLAGRKWGAGAFTVQDVAGDFLLASSGSTLTLYYLRSQMPTAQSAVTFSAPPSSAVLVGTKAVVLSNGALWTADVSQQAPAPVRVTAVKGTVAQLSGSAGGFAATEVHEDGTTTVHLWNGGNADAAPADVTIDGVATALASDGSAAAVFTFRGISILRVGGPAFVLPQSNTTIVSAMAISDGRLLALDDSSLRVWDPGSGTLERSFPIGSGTKLGADRVAPAAAVATASGLVYVNYAATTSLPEPLSGGAVNSYYRKAALSPSRLYLYDGRDVDVFETAGGPSPQLLNSFAAPKTIDLAAGDAALFTVSTDGVVGAYTPAGVLIRSAALDEGASATALSIAVVGGAPWVSISRGCTTATGCEKRTVVLDPQTLVRSASLAGGLVDVVTSSARAYAIFDMPAEIRVYDTTDPLHPNPTAVRPNDVSAVAIGYAAGSVYAVRDKVYLYDEQGLTPAGEKLASRTVTAPRLVVDGACAVLTGRAASAETYDTAQWSGGPALPVPGAARTIALSGGRLLIVTDYSVDVWSRTATPPARRRRVAR